MAATSKAKKTSTQRTSNIITSSKKKGLSHKQLGIIGVVAIVVVGIGAYLAIQTATTNAASCVNRTFRKGDSSVCVTYIQKIANATSGTGADVSIDTIFGAKTKAKVERYQRAKGLGDDGVVGSNTWKALCKRGEDTSTSPTRKAAGCKEHTRTSTVSLYKDGSHKHTTTFYSYSKN